MIQIFAIDKKTGEKEKVTDLFWFEEQSVHTFDGKGVWSDYFFEFFVNDKKVYSTQSDVVAH